MGKATKIDTPGKPNINKRLRAHVEAFILDNDITCADTVMQSDRVIENAYAFIEQCCEIVGYAHFDDE